MAQERNTRREILKKLLTLGPIAALAGAVGINGAKPVSADNLSGSGKILVQAAYHVKSGKDIIKTVPTRALSSAPLGQQAQQTPDLMTSQELGYASVTWDSVVAALQRLEL